MFRVSCLKSSRIARNFGSRNLSSVNKGKPETVPINNAVNSKPPASPFTFLLVSFAAASSIGLILNADNKDLAVQIDKHAPFLNTVLAPFRAPVIAAKVEKAPVKIESLPKLDVVVEQPSPVVVIDDSVANVVEEIIAEQPIVESVVPQPNVTTTVENILEQVTEETPVVSHPHSTFSAHDEVHQLEEKYEDDLYAVSQQHTDRDTPVNNAATIAAQSYPIEVNSSLLHHELQTQAKAILSELQNELHRQHERDLEIKYHHDLKEALREQAHDLEERRKHDLEAQATQIVTELQEELNHSVALIRKAQVDQLLTLQPKIDALQAQLKTFHEVANETASAVKQTVDTHHISSVVLALELALSQHHGENAALFIKDLQRTCKDDELVLAVLKALPENVVREGAMSHRELQVRFNIMRNEVRKVALAPEEAPKMLGQAIGTFLAWVTWVPKGHITGNGVEDALARADHHLERGRVKEALDELEQVEGYSQVLMSDFKQLALERLVVDQSISVLKAKSILRHRAFL